MATDGRSTRSLSQRWDDYQPTKSTLGWACVAAVAATMVAGFSWGGWVTGGTAEDVAMAASNTARGELAADICVERFNAAPDAAARLAEFKSISGDYQKRQFVEAGGWAVMPGETTSDRLGAQGCATALAA